MKKTSMLFAMTALGLTLMACKKDYVCKCEYAEEDLSNAEIYEDHSKKEAQDKCNQLHEGAQTVGGSCTLERS